MKAYQPTPPVPPPSPPLPNGGLAGSSCREFDTHVDMDILHGDMSSAPASTGTVEDCCSLCDRTAGCKGLTLTPSGDCWLKSSISAPTKQRGLISATRPGSVPVSNDAAVEDAAVAESIAVASADAGAATPEAQAATPAVAEQLQGSEGSQHTENGPEMAHGRAACGHDSPMGCMARPAVVVMTHARADMTRRCLGQLQEMALRERFTVYVSDDAGDPRVREAATASGIVQEVLVHQPRRPRTVFERGGLFKISEHFRAALEAVLTRRGHSHVVLVEDDLLLSPDFLRLFWQSAWLLERDPSLWCVSAWNDQGFPHTATDARQLLRTDYFPGLGWMIRAATWRELRERWPSAPTTGWDHWMRLSSTSHGRECVVPRINRSRHANSRGTNVLDNRPFERFTFEKKGVTDFGDLSYLMQQPYEDAFARDVRDARRSEWPAAWGGSRTQGAAEAWIGSIKTVELLTYTREQYRDLAKPLGIWAEAQRATHNGTISLQTKGGGLLLLADRRKCPYLEHGERLRPRSNDRPVAAAAGVSCDEACRLAGGNCDAPALEWGNTCTLLQAHFPCEAGCGHQVGPELPAYASSSSLDTYRQCLVSDIAISKCEAKYAKTRRLCFCSFGG